MSRNYPTPEEPIRKVEFGRDAKAIQDSIIGFINRDEQITERLTYPKVVPTLGADFLTPIRAKRSILWDNKAWASHVSDITESPECVPGIMSLNFVPVLADGEEVQASPSKQCYLAKWLNQRSFNNNVRNWQPGDEQFVDAAVGLIKMMMSCAARALICVRDVAMRSNNKYYNKVAFLKAMGFEFTEKGADLYYDRLWSYYNKSIVSMINSNQWLKYSYPGFNRWASLCEAIYRDTPAKTDYAQYFVFSPMYVPEFSEVFDAQGGKIGWEIGWKTDSQGELIRFSERYRVMAVSDPDARGYNGLMLLLDDIADLIKFVFYNDDTKDIIATLNMIAVRTTPSELAASETFNFQRLGFEPHDTTVMDAPIIYSSEMAIAIANATILPDVKPGPAEINATSGNMTQLLHCVPPAIDYNTPGYAWGQPMVSKSMGLRISKVINMPNFYPTQSDFINATQWTVALDGTFPETGHYTDDTIPSYAVGSDYIALAEIIQFAKKVFPGADPRLNQIEKDCSIASNYERVEYHQNVILVNSAQEANDFMSGFGTQDDPVQAMAATLYAYKLANQFANAPMAMEWQLAQKWDDPTMWEIAYAGPIVQSEVYWIADGAVLAGFHSQWKSNFYGFPIFNENNGVPTFSTNQGTSYDHFVDEAR